MSAGGSKLRKLDAISSTAVQLGFYCVWPVLFAVAIGATLFGLTHGDLLPEMFDNKLSEQQRLVGLGYFGVALLLVGAFYAAVLGYRYRALGPFGFEQARRLHPYLSFLLSGPFIVALTEPKLETLHGIRTFLYIALAVLAWWPTLHAIGDRDRSQPRRRPILSSRQLDLLSAGLVFALWLAYAYFFTKLAITNHHALNTRIIDLGIYDNIFFQSSHGRPLGCSLIKGGSHASAHFDPILVILSPLYRLWPRAEFLLTLQAVWCGAGVIPAYLLGRSQLGSRAWGLVWALVYALHPALHGANLYEFHSLTLLFAPLLLGLYFLLAGKLRLYFATLVLLLLIREDVSLLMCFVGLYAIISGEPGQKRAGWITIIVSLLYFVIVKRTVMASPELFNQGDGAYGFAYYYKEMIPHKEGGFDLVTTLLTNPGFVVALVAKEAKILYLLVIFTPLLFLPAWAGRARLMLVYGLVFTLLASKRAVFSSHFQYSAVLLPFAIALAPLGLRRLREAQSRDRGLTFAVMGCVLMASLLVSWKHGAILPNSSFRGGFGSVTRTLTPEAQERYESLVDFISQIEPDASVSVSNSLGAHVSNRLEVRRIRQRIDTDYILVDSRDLRGAIKSDIDKREEAGKIKLLERRGSWTLYQAASPVEIE